MEINLDMLRGLRETALRRATYARNSIALQDDAVPPEGVFDTALTNGLLLIVSNEWPGMEGDPKRYKSASQLLDVIKSQGGSRHVTVDLDVLREGLLLTQPFRHGRADDPERIITWSHVQALLELDEHPALGVVEQADGLTFSECVYNAFIEIADAQLPGDPKDRSLVPDPEDCEACGRPTFIRSGWDMFGGDSSPGYCVACGYVRTDEDANEQAIAEALWRALENPNA